MFEVAQEELLKYYETNEDDTEDAQTGCYSWIPVQTVIVAT